MPREARKSSSRAGSARTHCLVPAALRPRSPANRRPIVHLVDDLSQVPVALLARVFTLDLGCIERDAALGDRASRLGETRDETRVDERLHDSDVRVPACAAAPEHQGDPWRAALHAAEPTSGRSAGAVVLGP